MTAVKKLSQRLLFTLIDSLKQPQVAIALRTLKPKKTLALLIALALQAQVQSRHLGRQTLDSHAPLDSGSDRSTAQ